GSESQRAAALALGASQVCVGRAADALTPKLEPQSHDAALDCVAGPLFPALVKSLRRRGGYCVVGAVGGSEVPLDVWDLLSGIALPGYSSEDLDGAGLREATAQILKLKLPPLPRTVVKLAD